MGFNSGFKGLMSDSFTFIEDNNMHELQFKILFVYVNIHQIKPEAIKISETNICVCSYAFGGAVINFF